MADLTIEQLIKIILIVVVIVAVVLGMYFIFKNYIFPSFSALPGADPGNEILTPGLSDDELAEIVRPENEIAEIKENYFYVNGKKTSYYLKSGKEIKKSEWRLDRTVGKIINDREIQINKAWLSDDDLAQLDGGIKYENKIYKKR